MTRWCKKNKAAPGEGTALQTVRKKGGQPMERMTCPLESTISAWTTSEPTGNSKTKAAARREKDLFMTLRFWWRLFIDRANMAGGLGRRIDPVKPRR